MRLSLSVLGMFDLRGQDNASILPRGRKAKGIVAFAAFAGGSPVSRNELIDLFWSDRAAAQGQASLRQCIHEIRAGFGPNADRLLSTDRTSVTFHSAQIVCDLWDRNGELRHRANGIILRGLDPVAPVFDEWLFGKRREIESQLLASAERQLAGVDDDDSTAVLEVGNFILQIDPCNEVAARRVMSAYARQDRVSRARSIFTALQSAIGELGFNVSSKTVQHFEAIGRAKKDGVAGGMAEAKSVYVAENRSDVRGVPVLAIEQFQVQSKDAEPALAEYLHQETMDRLVELQELRITALNDAAPSGYLLSGSVRSGQDNRVLCSMRITSVRDGISVWTARSSLAHNPAPEELDEFVAEISAGILASIERRELELRSRSDKGNGSAYDLYLRSKHNFFGAKEPSYVFQVAKDLEKAIELDPLFAPAYDHLIQIYNTGMFFSQVGSDMAEPRRRALELAQHLLTINAQNSHAHIAMAWCQIWQRNFFAAERAIETAIELMPYEAHRLNSIATALVYLGRLDEAEAFYMKAQRRMSKDMDFQRTDLGELHYMKRDFESALGWLESGEVRARYRTLFWRIPTYAQLGRLEEARQDAVQLEAELRDKWAGSEPYSAMAGLKWYLDFKVMKRARDRELLLDGLAKAGLA